MNKDKIIQKGFCYRERQFETSRCERRYLEKLLDLIPKTGKILDVGCGYGFLAFHMLSGDREIFATDLVKGIDKKALLNGVTFKKMTKGKFPFKDNTFDSVVSTDVIEHVEDEAAFMKECWRVLKKGARVIISTPNIYRLAFWLRSLVFKKPKFPVKPAIDPIFGIDQHLREYNQKTLVALFEKNNWQNLKVSGFGFGFGGSAGVFIPLDQPFDFFCSQLIAIAEKD